MDQRQERRPGRTTRRQLLLGGSSLLVLASCAAPTQMLPARAFEPPRIRIGDRWVYREINRYNGYALGTVEETVTGLAPVRLRVVRQASVTTAGEISRRGSVTEERFAPGWSVIHEPTYDLPLDFNSPMPLLPPGMTVGERVRSRTRFAVNGYWGLFDWDQSLRAVGVERITTPAGTFDCLRVNRDIRFDSPDRMRRDSTRTDELWYAAEINRWVRREWTGRYRHDGFLDTPGLMHEDWVRWDLVSYVPAAG